MPTPPPRCRHFRRHAVSMTHAICYVVSLLRVSAPDAAEPVRLFIIFGCHTPHAYLLPFAASITLMSAII
jgi:hypothetical protein